MKITAFGASTSSRSINHQLAAHAAGLIGGETDLLRLGEYPLPVYSADLEESGGVPGAVQDFLARLDAADLLVISLAEHNGSYTAAFKNLLDWASRARDSLFGGKRVLLLSTSPGARGGQGVMEAALDRFPRLGAVIAGHFSLPSFYQNFQAEAGITNETERARLAAVIAEVMKDATD